MTFEPPAGHGPDDKIDTTAIILDALRSKFGDDALAVATRQRDSASADTRPVWADIADRLESE